MVEEKDGKENDMPASAAPPPPSPPQKRLFGGQQQNGQNPPNSTSSDSYKVRLRYPSLSICHVCNSRCKPKEKLETLDSQWRIVLVCKTCVNNVESAKICSYCFEGLSDKGVVCRYCKHHVHDGCFTKYTGFNFCPNKESFSCIDCWVPKSSNPMRHSKRKRCAVANAASVKVSRTSSDVGADSIKVPRASSEVGTASVKVSRTTSDVGAASVKASRTSSDVAVASVKVSRESFGVGAGSVKVSRASSDGGTTSVKVSRTFSDVGADSIKVPSASSEVGTASVKVSRNTSDVGAASVKASRTSSDVAVASVKESRESFGGAGSVKVSRASSDGGTTSAKLSRASDVEAASFKVPEASSDVGVTPVMVSRASSDVGALEDAVKAADSKAEMMISAAVRAKEKAEKKAEAARLAAEKAEKALNLALVVAREKTQEKGTSEFAVDDAELALRLHRAINSSSRIIKNFSLSKLKRSNCDGYSLSRSLVPENPMVSGVPEDSMVCGDPAVCNNSVVFEMNGVVSEPSVDINPLQNGFSLEPRNMVSRVTSNVRDLEDAVKTSNCDGDSLVTSLAPENPIVCDNSVIVEKNYKVVLEPAVHIDPLQNGSFLEQRNGVSRETSEVGALEDSIKTSNCDGYLIVKSPASDNQMVCEDHDFCNNVVVEKNDKFVSEPSLGIDNLQKDCFVEPRSEVELEVSAVECKRNDADAVKMYKRRLKDVPVKIFDCKYDIAELLKEEQRNCSNKVSSLSVTGCSLDSESQSEFNEDPSVLERRSWHSLDKSLKKYSRGCRVMAKDFKIYNRRQNLNQILDWKTKLFLEDTSASGLPLWQMNCSQMSTSYGNSSLSPSVPSTAPSPAHSRGPFQP